MKINNIFLVFLFISSLGYSQSTIDKFWLHRSLKKMRKEHYDTTKVDKIFNRIEKVSEYKDSTKGVYFETKYLYVKDYNGILSKLCSLYLEPDFTSGPINVQSDSSLINFYIQQNQARLDYLESSQFRKKIMKRYYLNYEKLKCTQRYLEELRKKQTEYIDTSGLEEESTKIEVSDFHDMINVLDNIADTNTVNKDIESLTFVGKSGDSLFVTFNFFTNKQAFGFDKGKYIFSESQRAILNFCDFVQNIEGLRRNDLKMSVVRGEADANTIGGIEYSISNRYLNNFSLSIHELHPETKKQYSTYTLTLKDGNDITENRNLAAVRAYYARNIFERYVPKYSIREYEVIDHDNTLSLSQKNKKTGKYRTVSFYLLFASEEIGKLDDFYFNALNFKVGKSELKDITKEELREIIENNWSTAYSW